MKLFVHRRAFHTREEAKAAMPGFVVSIDGSDTGLFTYYEAKGHILELELAPSAAQIIEQILQSDPIEQTQEILREEIAKMERVPMDRAGKQEQGP